MPTAAKTRSSYILYAIFLLFLSLNFVFWMQSKKVLVKWNDVPSAPSADTAGFAAIGDHEIAYRMFGYFLLNAGNTGGNYESLKKYDYATLVKWFEVTRQLDGRSDFVPFLAAYYFGAVEDDPVRLRYIVDYLVEEGKEPYPEKWRWFAQAVYLARYKINDQELALSLANELAAMPTYVAPWARQLPAFIQLKMGNRQAAYEIMARMLASEGEKLHPNEVNEMINFICTRALDKSDAAKNPLCQGRK